MAKKVGGGDVWGDWAEVDGGPRGVGTACAKRRKRGWALKKSSKKEFGSGKNERRRA